MGTRSKYFVMEVVKEVGGDKDGQEKEVKKEMFLLTYWIIH